MRLSNPDLRRSFEERWRHLGDLPNWFLFDHEWWSEACEVFKDYRKAKGILFSTLLKNPLGEGERARILLPTLWDLDPREYGGKWLSKVCGLDIAEIQEIFESSAVGAVYRCLDCMNPLPAARTRNQAFLRNKALMSIRLLRGGLGQVIAAETVCELLCPNCVEHHLRKRQDRIQELQAMYYRGFLRSDEWIAISMLKLDEAEYLCAICQRTKKPMDVHHLRYDRRGDEHLNDLLVLCNSHHRFLHRLQQEASREEG